MINTNIRNYPGFLMMVPSLYINYRLKSVAHLPGKTMMYKFLNTFIDDLFGMFHSCFINTLASTLTL